MPATAMAALNTSITVDVELPDTQEAAFEIDPLSLTARDQEFLRNVGIETQQVADAGGF